MTTEIFTENQLHDGMRGLLDMTMSEIRRILTLHTAITYLGVDSREQLMHLLSYYNDLCTMIEDPVLNEYFGKYRFELTKNQIDALKASGGSSG
jgi:hypothetical protein